MHVIAPLDKQFPLLYVILKDHIADDPDYKVCFQSSSLFLCLLVLRKTAFFKLIFSVYTTTMQYM
jgi:hypothetical protein